MSKERAVKTINQHTKTEDYTKRFNIAVQPQSGAGSGAGGVEGEHFHMDLEEKLALYVKFLDVVNNLVQTDPGTALDGRQGKVLKDLIDAIMASKGVADGIATLDSSGLIPPSQLPPLAIVDVFPDVQSEQDMLALEAQQGDIAIRTDTDQVFILVTDPASTLGNWAELSVLSSLLDEVKGSGWSGETIKGNAEAVGALEDDFDDHKVDPMPHLLYNEKEDKKYQFGFRVNAEGHPQMVYKEV